MVEFTTEFLEALRRRLPELREALLGGDSGGHLLADRIRSIWEPTLPKEDPPERVVAVDGSLCVREYGGGISVVYARAVAVSFSDGAEEVRARVCDVVPSAGPPSDVKDLASRVMEHLEHLAALSALPDDGGVLLLDGSLFSRYSSAAFNFPRRGALAVDYALTLGRLLREARSRGVSILAVAKSSRASPLVELLLQEAFTDLMKRLASIIPPTELNPLEVAWRSSPVDPEEGVSLAVKLASNHPEASEELSLAARLFLERHRRTADVDAIARSTRGVGRTPPLLAGPYTHPVRAQLESLRLNPERVVRECCSGPGAEMIMRGENPREFKRRASRAVDEVLRLPAPVTVYARFGERDGPLKLEFPCWELGLNLPWSEAGPRLLGAGADRPVSIARAGYAGPRRHNVWLEEADRRVKLRRDVVDRVYEKLMWRELGEVVPHARGERRVLGI